MGDEYDGHTELGLQAAHQVEDLGFGSYVQCRGRFVSDEEARMARQGHGNDAPLTHPSRQLMRVTIDHTDRIRHAHQTQHLDGLLPGFFFAHFLVENDPLHDLSAERVHRVEESHRLLEDHGDIPPANGANLVPVRIQRRQVDDLARAAIPADIAIQVDLAPHDPTWLLNQAQDRVARHGLATAALSEHAKRPPRLDGKADPVYRPDDPSVQEKVRLEVFDLEQMTLIRHRHSLRLRSRLSRQTDRPRRASRRPGG